MRTAPNGQKISPTEKLVLLMFLIDTTIALEDLAEQCAMDLGTCKRHLFSLADKGVLRPGA